MFNEEIFGIINDADEVLECVGVDPFGMVCITEASSDIFSMLNNPKLGDPTSVRKLKKEIQRCQRWEKILKVLQKLNIILAAAVAAKGAHDISKANQYLSRDKGRQFDNVMSNTRDIVNDVADDIIQSKAIKQTMINRGTIPGVDAGQTKHLASRMFGGGGKVTVYISQSGSSYDGSSYNDLLAQHVSDSQLELDNTKKATITILLIQAAIAVLIPLMKKAIKNKEIKNISSIEGQVDSAITLYESQIIKVKSEDDKKRLQGAIDDLNALKKMMGTEK